MMSIEIPLTKGYVAIVDDEDADLAALKWQAIANDWGVYGRHSGGTRKHPEYPHLHRVIMERVILRSLLKSEEVDHIDGNTLNTKRDNLRIATRSQNQQNRAIGRNNKSGFKGVSWNSNSKAWQVYIRVNGANHYLGLFTDPAIGHQAYLQAAQEAFGEFAANAERTLRR